MDDVALQSGTVNWLVPK